MSFSLRSLALYIQPAGGGAVSDSVTLTVGNLALAGVALTINASGVVTTTVGNLALAGGAHTMGAGQAVALTPSTMILGPGSSWTPDQLPGSRLARWYDASQNDVLTDNTAVNHWVDSSPNADNITAFGYLAAAKPTIQTNVLNSLPAMEFQGNQFFDTEGSIGVSGDQFAIIFVERRDTANTVDDYWTSKDPNDSAFSVHTESGGFAFDEMATFQPPGGGGAYDSIVYSEQLDQQWHVHVQVYDRTSSFATIDGLEEVIFYGDTGDMTGSSIAQGLTIAWDEGTGSGPVVANSYSGMMAEFAVINGAVSAQEARVWEGYLAHKYALTANLPTSHPYKTHPPYTVLMSANTAVALTAGNLALAGGSHTMTHTHFLTTTVGAMALTGNTLTVNAGSSVTTTVGAMALAGGTHTATNIQPVALTVGNLALGGNAVTAETAISVGLTAGNMALAGGAHTLSGGSTVALTAGNISLSGNTVTESHGGSVALSPGNLALAGGAHTLNDTTPAVTDPPFVQGYV